MTKRILRKSVVISIVLLFLGMGIVPSTGTIDIKHTVATLDGDTLYVGGNGTGNYTRIQDAIDNASDGDTIFVYDDSSPYYENVVVDKSINLIGEDRNTTVIDGSNIRVGIGIITNWVNISGFTIQHCNISNYYGIYIHGSSNNIIGNNILNNGCGILISNSISNTITGNNISNNGCGGITLLSSSRNIITGNNIRSNDNTGIRLYNSSSNTITDNNISNNRDGIYLYSSNHNTITGNNIISNNNYGINISSSSNTILKNNFLDNKRHAFFKNCKNCTNTWEQNYWNRPRILPKLIFGTIELGSIWIRIPWFNIDWRPAQEPYDIEV